MTASLQASKKDGKYYIHLNWIQDGKRKQKCIGTGLFVKDDNKRRAERMRREVLAEWERKIAENTTDILFSDFLLQWLEATKHTRAETTTADYRIVLTKTVCPYFAERHIRLIDLTPKDLNDFYNHRMEHDGISNNTVRRHGAIIHKALDYAVKNQQRRDNPADAVELPKYEVHTAKFLTADELKKLIEAAKGTRAEAVIMLAAWFGMRREEIIGLRWENVNLETGTLFVKEAAAKADRIIIKEPKTKSSFRVFPLTPPTIAYFKQLKEQQEANRKRLRGKYCTQWLDYVCVDSSGNLIDPNYASRAVPKLCEKCGIEKVHLHELRHTNISLLLAQGEAMKDMQEWAGHSSYSTTANIYAHVQPGVKTLLAQSIQAALG